MKSTAGEIIAAIIAASIAGAVAAVAGSLVGVLIYGAMLRDMGDKGFESLRIVVGAPALIFAVVAFIFVYLKMTVYADPPDEP